LKADWLLGTVPLFDQIKDFFKSKRNKKEEASIKDLKDYINAMNREFNKNYDTSFKGRDAVDKLRRVIRVGLLKAYDDL
jgi:hypothetical protein